MNSSLKTIKLRICDMHCTSCALSIDMDLEDLPGIRQSKTSYAKAQTEVEFDPQMISQEAIVIVIAKTGYRAII